MPPCSSSQPLARLRGQFFQLLVGKKGPAFRHQALGGAGRGWRNQHPQPVPLSPKSWKEATVHGVSSTYKALYWET